MKKEKQVKEEPLPEVKPLTDLLGFFPIQQLETPPQLFNNNIGMLSFDLLLPLNWLMRADSEPTWTNCAAWREPVLQATTACWPIPSWGSRGTQKVRFDFGWFEFWLLLSHASRRIRELEAMIKEIEQKIREIQAQNADFRALLNQKDKYLSLMNDCFSF